MTEEEIAKIRISCAHCAALERGSVHWFDGGVTYRKISGITEDRVDVDSDGYTCFAAPLEGGGYVDLDNASLEDFYIITNII